MARVFISGASTGLGLMAGQLLVEQGHRVVFHARNDERCEDARRARHVTEQVNRLGRFDAVIHNAGASSWLLLTTPTDRGVTAA
jgi:D-arabinose 1-dehydrogenase-like Zn-dependent alcohol dehydrogenase